VLARFLAQRLQAALGQNVIIENRAGAGGALGARTAAASEADGYTIFFGNTSTLAVIPAVSKNPGYDPAKDFAAVASVSESYMILVVHPDFPAKTLREFIAHAKANPGKLNFGNAGAGNVTHLTGEMLRAATGIEFVNVPHRGGAESISSLLGRQVDFLLESPVVLLPLIREGRLRALAVTSAQRTSEAADIPTMREGGADFVTTLLTGVVAPAGTPVAAVARLNAAINESLKTPQMQDTLAKFGSTAKITTPQEFEAFLADETKKWADVAKAARVQID
jgi:tripartite-type tricarboxylate transporter receptor subunit TctC